MNAAAARDVQAARLGLAGGGLSTGAPRLMAMRYAKRSVRYIAGTITPPISAVVTRLPASTSRWA